jgi:glycosyltransferase involved in cell wall biosynthesis
MNTLPTYVIVTPARNEAQFIELTIKSVLGQTKKPLRWIIVSDGSTDGTDDIVRKYAAEYSWIELVRMPERQERNFAGKVYSFDAGYQSTRGLKYDVIVSLDADISFGEDYFAYLLEKLSNDAALGLVGTPFKERTNSTYDYRFVNIEHVSGACQVFRRRCFEEIGGYKPVKSGCIDHIAVVSARMKGWKTRTFTDQICFHHRAMGTAQQNIMAARFKGGRKDYLIGNHPLWELSRVIYQLSRQPIVLGGLMLACGYAWAMIRHEKRPVSAELVAFVRREQLARLKSFLVGNRLPKRRQSPEEATSACS